MNWFPTVVVLLPVCVPGAAVVAAVVSVLVLTIVVVVEYPLSDIEFLELLDCSLSLDFIVVDELGVVKGDVGEHFVEVLRDVDFVHVLCAHLVPDTLVADHPSACQRVYCYLLCYLTEHVAADFHNELLMRFFFILNSRPLVVAFLGRLFFLDNCRPGPIICQHIVIIVRRGRRGFRLIIFFSLIFHAEIFFHRKVLICIFVSLDFLNESCVYESVNFWSVF